MKSGTPDTNSFCAEGMSFLMFHSASGPTGRRIPNIAVTSFDRAPHQDDPSSLRKVSAFLSTSAPTLMRGPIATSVICPGKGEFAPK